MSTIVKSFSFPEGEIRGDTFYIKHGSNNFTVIDCYLKDGNDKSCRKEEIINEIISESSGRICRFISTHPDNDHIKGIENLDAEWEIMNFYAVANEILADKNDSSLTKYIQLKKDKNYPIERGISRKWLNIGDSERGGSGLNFEWPIVDDEKYKEALKAVSKGESPNNISCILTYSVQDGATYMWMGDMESDMQQEYYDKCKDNISQVDILFQPHHGRKSGAVPQNLLDALSPKLIIVGNAPSEHIDYGDSDKTITQNSAGDIMFVNQNGYVEILTQHKIENVPSIIDTKEKGWKLFNNKCWYKVGILKV